MSGSDTTYDILDAIRHRSAKRRDLLRYAGQATALAGGLTFLSACGDSSDGTAPPLPPAPSPTPTPTAAPAPAPTSTPGIADADIPYFQFLLNIEYLRASFFLNTSTFTVLDPADTSGTVGTQGTVTVTAGTAKGNAAVNFDAKDASVFANMFATEMANVSVGHVRKLRQLLGAKTIAIPKIDLEGGRADSTGAWYTAALGAGVVKGGAAFNPSSLIATFNGAASFINSATLAAYRGVVPKVTPAGAAILAGFIGAISYQTSLIRNIAYIQSKGTSTNQLVYIQKFSDYSDSLDGSTDLDQGTQPGQGFHTSAASNIIAADSNGLALARSPEQALNVFYLTSSSVSSGGFFPNGVNGTIVASANAAAI